MKAILIIDAIGNIREWFRSADQRDIDRYIQILSVKDTPNPNGWILHRIVTID